MVVSETEEGRMYTGSLERPEDVDWIVTNMRPCKVGPPKAFSDRVAEISKAEELQGKPATRVGPDSACVEMMFGSNCCGWIQPPTGPELYDAMRTGRPTSRQRAVLETWIIEGTMADWLFAWMEQAYSWRMLARAIRITRAPAYDKIRLLNTYAEELDLINEEDLPIDR